MGHYETTTEMRERPEIRAKIDKCQSLIDTLTECKSTAEEYKTAADTAVEECKTVVNQESDNLSGVYYEEKYIPYRDGFFTDIEALDDGCDSMFGEIDDRIQKLQEMIEKLNEELWEEVEISYWVEDD